MNQPDKTPAKLILSGEHAVLYGCQAIVCAVNHYAKTTITSNGTDNFSFNCPALGYKKTFFWNELVTIRQQLTQCYQAFINGEISIKNVLSHPAQLCLYTFGLCLEHFNHTPTCGLDITIEVDIPIGSGMGSSAAVIISMVRALCKHYDQQITGEKILAIALKAENLQHGKSSGLDINACYYGGINHYHDHNITRLNKAKLPFYCIYTGRPQNTTGECMHYVKQHFSSSTIWNDFDKVTQCMHEALYHPTQSRLAEAINDNHQLLCEINVAPKVIQQFIKQLNNKNIAAKICGAGAITGDKAGMLISTMGEAAIELCHEYGYKIAPLEVVYYDQS